MSLEMSGRSLLMPLYCSNLLVIYPILTHMSYMGLIHFQINKTLLHAEHAIRKDKAMTILVNNQTYHT